MKMSAKAVNTELTELDFPGEFYLMVYDSNVVAMADSLDTAIAAHWFEIHNKGMKRRRRLAHLERKRRRKRSGR